MLNDLCNLEYFNLTPDGSFSQASKESSEDPWLDQCLISKRKTITDSNNAGDVQKFHVLSVMRRNMEHIKLSLDLAKIVIYFRLLRGAFAFIFTINTPKTLKLCLICNMVAEKRRKEKL